MRLALFRSRAGNFAAFLLFLGVLSSACSRITPRKPVSELERWHIASEFQRAVEAAGGLDVWVKGFPARPQHFSEQPIEVLTIRANYGKMLAVFREEARKENLQVSIRPLIATGGLRSAAVRLSQGKELVGQWRCREVSQLRRAAIVIDDLGQDLEAAQELIRRPYPLTLSILPDLPFSAKTAEEAHRAGREVILHLPMEPEPASGAKPGPGAIKVGMTQETVTRMIEGDLNSVPYAIGANNHMGSRATANAPLMLEVMKVLAERRMFFIDSRTTADSAALSAARRVGIPTFYRSVFLDDTETTAYTLGQLREFRRVVEEQGVALAIGHPHPSTLLALAQFLPTLEQDDIQLVPASELVRLPEVSELSPPPEPRKTAKGKVSNRQ